MYVIGLTGGIGSGKSTIAVLFAELGIEIINADQIAREIVAPNTKALATIVERFGTNILLDDKSLNRKKLREIVFKKTNELKWLEQLTHPLIRNLLVQRLHSAVSPYVILESPLLLETQQKELVDRVLVVDVDEATQLTRSKDRDGSSIETIKAIISTQISRSERLEAADDILDNSRSLAEAKNQIYQLHEEYLVLANL